MVDKDTEFTAVAAMNGELVVDYTFPHHLASQINIPKFREGIAPMVKTVACEQLAGLSPQLRFRARYMSADKVRLADILVKASDCQAH
jgi:hypothetical protein